MKKILFVLLIVFSSSMYSQESVIDLFKSKEKRAKELFEKKEKLKSQTGKKVVTSLNAKQVLTNKKK